MRYAGASVKRIEDPRLLRGRGRYLDDLALPRMLSVAFARSPHAHARVGGQGRARGSHRRHGLAAEPHDAVGERRPRGGRESRVREPRDERACDPPELGGRDDRGDAVERARRGGVHAREAGVGVRAPGERDPEHARQGQVVEVAAAPPHEARVLEAPDARPNVAARRAAQSRATAPTTRGSTSPAISSSCSSPQSSGFSTIVSTPPSSAAIRALIRRASSSASPSR